MSRRSKELSGPAYQQLAFSLPGLGQRGQLRTPPTETVSLSEQQWQAKLSSITQIVGELLVIASQRVEQASGLGKNRVGPWQHLTDKLLALQQSLTLMSQQKSLANFDQLWRLHSLLSEIKTTATAESVGKLVTSAGRLNSFINNS